MSESTIIEVRQLAALLFQSGDVVEVRVPKSGKQRTISGYFNDHEKLAQAVAPLEFGKYPGVYWTINPVNPELLARAANRTRGYADDLTKDHDILHRVWLPVDFDPKRPTGISSTEAEHDAAIALAERVSAALMAEGWPEPVKADSGNGAHLLYRIDLPNDDDAELLLKNVLLALSERFNTKAEEGPMVEVDRTTFNASRIFKIYGTTARKGDHTAERPHRLSRLLHAPALITPVSPEMLRALANLASRATRQIPQQSRSFSGRRAEFNLREFLLRHGVHFREPVADNGGWKYVLEHCPFDSEHRAPDSAVWEYSDGYGFKCFHNSCADRDWKAFREYFEGPRPQRSYSPRPPFPRDEDAPPAPPREQCDADLGRDASAELPLSVGDVEAAIDAAISANDLVAAMRLIPDVARTPEHTQALITSKLRLKFKRDFSAREFTRALRAAQEEIAKQSKPVVHEEDLPPENAPDLLPFPLTDSGNAERILKLYGDDIRFCPEFKKWMLWDGQRWRVDTDAGTVTQKVKNMARLLWKQAMLIEENGRRKMFQEHARDCESQASISAALLRAKSEPGMQISATDLDKHRYLLNCPNGVVDVRSGELLPADRRYYITKLCHVKYNPESKAERDCPRFLKLLNWAMGESADTAELPERVTRMVSFLQKAFGYALTGDVSEKAAFIFYGAKGNNGKTTLLTVFKTILAEYAAQLDINTLMTSKFTDNNVRADLAKLHGARFVITSEVDDGQRLSERLMKYLTAGMGEITACRKFENPFEFFATHKIWMDCNYRPEIKGADEAIWGRLMCVAFLQRMDKNDPEMDKQLIDKILAESEGVLAWAVRGAMRWAKEGLGVPIEVQEAVAEWRDADDPLKGFFEECCDLDLTDPSYWAGCVEFTRAYAAWCKENNEPQLKSSRLTQRLKLRGIELNRSRRRDGKQFRSWDGVRLREDVTQVSGPRGYWSGEDQTF